MTGLEETLTSLAVEERAGNSSRPLPGVPHATAGGWHHQAIDNAANGHGDQHTRRRIAAGRRAAGGVVPCGREEMRSGAGTNDHI